MTDDLLTYAPGALEQAVIDECSRLDATPVGTVRVLYSVYPTTNGRTTMADAYWKRTPGGWTKVADAAGRRLPAGLGAREAGRGIAWAGWASSPALAVRLFTLRNIAEITRLTARVEDMQAQIASAKLL